MRRPIRPLDLIRAALALVAVAVLWSLLLDPAESQPAPASLDAPVLPAYDQEGRLLLPEEWRRWVFVGSSLGLGYSEGGGGSEMFHETLMEPTAYEHFTRTGEFRDGTMLVLLLHGAGDSALPQRRGRFAGELAGLEMAVKDSRAEDTWSYYGFGGRAGLRDRAGAIPAVNCNSCHVEHAAHDNVFVQFYPLLREVAPAGTVFRSGAGVELAATPGDSPGEPPVEPPALGGLDPVLLTEGRAELGKPEIVMAHGGLTYRFVSEPTRLRFERDPERYAAQNETCPVVAGAPVDPQLFSVYEGRIYLFASQQCISDFLADPDRYLDPEVDPEVETESPAMQSSS